MTDSSNNHLTAALPVPHQLSVDSGGVKMQQCCYPVSHHFIILRLSHDD